MYDDHAILSKLRDAVKEKTFVDVGPGAEKVLGIDRSEMVTALIELNDEGYFVQQITATQKDSKNWALIQVLAPSGTTYKEVMDNISRIAQLTV